MAEPLTVTALCVAGGSGERLGAAVPKAFVQVGGVTLLEHALRPITAHPGIRDVVVVAPSAWLDKAAGYAPSALVVAGGATRQDSVAAGMAALADDVDAVLVHDVARPFVPAEVIDRVLAALADGAGAVIPALPVTDTIKRVSAAGTVTATFTQAMGWL